MSAPGAGYRVASGTATAELRDRASKFLAYLGPATSVERAREFVAEIGRRHPDATHVCFAWRVGWPPEERSADAGEPGGTAGAPILGALRSAGLSDTVAAVARWFGGTRLGKGGLVRAYGGVVRSALAALPVRAERPRVRILVSFPLDRAGAVRRLLRPPEVELAAERWGEAAEVELAVTLEHRERILAALADLGLAARER
jgi:uncharacterized YigZ family protein